MPKPYVLTPERRETFSILFLLDYVENQESLPILLEGDNTLLDSLVRKAFSMKLMEIQGLEYRASTMGKEKLRLFMKRYSDFLATMDVFHSVDLTKGEFAMASYWDMDVPDYEILLKDPRWEDLRVAVAEYKKIDPLEIVFMSFLNEGRFDSQKPGWQFELALGTAWDEIVSICSTNLQADDLGYMDGKVSISGETVLRDVIKQGTDLMFNLLKQEIKLREEGALDPVEVTEPDVITVTVVTETSYYDPWYDPLFVPLFWYDPYW